MMVAIQDIDVYTLTPVQLMSPAFLGEGVAPQLYNTALDMIHLWKEKSRLFKGRPFVAQHDVSHGALDCIWAAAFGSQIGTVKSQYTKLSNLNKIGLPENTDSPAKVPTTPTPEAFDSIITLTNSLEIATSSPIPRWHHWFALKFYPSLVSAGKHKDKLIQDRLDEAWKRFTRGSKDDDQANCALDYLVQREVTIAKKENRPPQYDTPAIKDELFGFLIAGHDTTSTTISWGLKHLTSNQQVQANVQSALRTHHKRAHDAGHAPTVDEIVKADIPYLDATIEEFHRLGGTASSNVRRALCDTEVLGYPIPKGTDVFMINNGPGYISAPLHVDDSKRSQSSIDNKDRYGMWEVSNIGAFQPERWLKKNEKGEMEFNPRAGPAHPFGAGPRGCFGRKLGAFPFPPYNLYSPS